MTLTRENYFDDPRISASMLRDLAKSPAHFHAFHVAKTAKRMESSAMRFGSAFHAAVLEPDEYERGYVVSDWDARTKEGKARRDEALALNLSILDRDDAETIRAMRAAILTHPVASVILGSRTHTEEPIFWTDPLTGVECKGKPDAVCSLGGRVSIVDLKTTSDADPESFSRSIANYDYHMQAGHYLRGWREVTGEWASFVFIAIEKTAPYAIGIYELDEESIAKGTAKSLGLLQILKTCREANSWPGYAATTIGLPKWAA
jgi:hypothetical protein